jgi:hypothetical protein
MLADISWLRAYATVASDKNSRNGSTGMPTGEGGTISRIHGLVLLSDLYSKDRSERTDLTTFVRHFDPTVYTKTL